MQTITRLIIIPIIIITGAWFELCNFSTNGRERKTGGCVVRYVMHFVFKLLCMMIWWSFLMDIYQKYHNGSWNRTYQLSLFFEKYLKWKIINRCLTPLCLLRIRTIPLLYLILKDLLSISIPKNASITCWKIKRYMIYSMEIKL